jgi:hypothetical protein
MGATWAGLAPAHPANTTATAATATQTTDLFFTIVSFIAQIL